MDTAFHIANRSNIAAVLNGGLLVLSAYSRMQRTNDAAHLFQQESNFWYLSGVEEPDWLLIIDGMQQRSWLVMPEISEVHRTFDGSLDPNKAKQISGVNSVVSADEGLQLLHSLAKRHSVAYTVGQSAHADQFNF